MACGSKPSVTAVPITAPWDKMNLPVKENAVVWESNDKIFKAVHNDDKMAVMTKYIDSLKGQGWEQISFDNISGDFYSKMQKDDLKIEIQAYNYKDGGVGVIIDKK
jgi:hypothetical protein